MSRRVNINDNEIFAVSDKVILVDEHESIFAVAEQIGVDSKEGVLMLTFTGRLNRTAEVTDVTVLMSLQDGFAFTAMLVDKYEWLISQQNPQGEENE